MYIEDTGLNLANAQFTNVSDNIPARSFTLLTHRLVRFPHAPLDFFIARLRLACFVNKNVQDLTYHAFFSSTKKFHCINIPAKFDFICLNIELTNLLHVLFYIQARLKKLCRQKTIHETD